MLTAAQRRFSLAELRAACASLPEPGFNRLTHIEPPPEPRQALGTTRVNVLVLEPHACCESTKLLDALASVRWPERIRAG